jgi:hypothetical protein
MKKLSALFLSLILCGFASAAPAHVVGHVVKRTAKVVSYPVVHPVKTAHGAWKVVTFLF